jgi:hypothetical protein
MPDNFSVIDEIDKILAELNNKKLTLPKEKPMKTLE